MQTTLTRKRHWPVSDRAVLREMSIDTCWYGGTPVVPIVSSLSKLDISVWLVNEPLHMLLLLRNALLTSGCRDVRAFTRSEQLLEALGTSRKPDIIIADDNIRQMAADELLHLAHRKHAVAGGILLSNSSIGKGVIPGAYRVLAKGQTRFCERLTSTVQSCIG